MTGILYPGLITVVAKLLFPDQAQGSLIKSNDQVVGSALIGQYFSVDKYFIGRPSVTPNAPYNAAFSSGSNLAPSNQTYLSAVRQRVLDLQKINQTQNKVPIDLVTASGSGLDPDISFQAALFQIPRIAAARKIQAKQLEKLVRNSQKKNIFDPLGTITVNVLKLNLALDAMPVEGNKHE